MHKKPLAIMKQNKVSIIICAYNEQATIEKVVCDVKRFNLDHELIVVDDGSADATPDILRELQGDLDYRAFFLSENKGKSFAMAYGVEQATGDIILFFDADLSDIREEHFNLLLTPMYEGKTDMVLGQPSETLIDYRINPFRSLTGQRAMRRKDLLPLLDDIRGIRFGVETFINLYYQAKGKRIQYVLLHGLKHPTKYAKTTPVQATKEFVAEGQEIAVTMIDNYGLILQRVDYLMGRANKSVRVRAAKMQHELNKRIVRFKDKAQSLRP